MAQGHQDGRHHPAIGRVAEPPLSLKTTRGASSPSRSHHVGKRLRLSDRRGNLLESPALAPVAQLDRVPGYEPGGRGFESCRARHYIKGLAQILSLALFLFPTLFRLALLSTVIAFDGDGACGGQDW